MTLIKFKVRHRTNRLSSLVSQVLTISSFFLSKVTFKFSFRCSRLEGIIQKVGYIDPVLKKLSQENITIK